MQLKKTSLLLLIMSSILFAREESVRVYFSEDQIADRLIEAIDSETVSLKVAVYNITHRGIIDAVIRAKHRGVAVEVVVDPSSLRNAATMNRLVEGKVPLFVWEKGIKMKQDGKRKGLMHDKFCVFGGDKVWTGSFNFTYDAANRHRENALLVQDPKVAGQYLAQFSKIQSSESRPYHEYKALYPKKKKQKKSFGGMIKP